MQLGFGRLCHRKVLRLTFPHMNLRSTNALDYFALSSCIAVSCRDNTHAPKPLSDISFRHNLRDPTDYV